MANEYLSQQAEAKRGVFQAHDGTRYRPFESDQSAAAVTAEDLMK